MNFDLAYLSFENLFATTYDFITSFQKFLMSEIFDVNNQHAMATVILLLVK